MFNTPYSRRDSSLSIFDAIGVRQPAQPSGLLVHKPQPLAKKGRRGSREKLKETTKTMKESKKDKSKKEGREKKEKKEKEKEIPLPKIIMELPAGQDIAKDTMDCILHSLPKKMDVIVSPYLEAALRVYQHLHVMKFVQVWVRTHTQLHTTPHVK